MPLLILDYTETHRVTASEYPPQQGPVMRYFLSPGAILGFCLLISTPLISANPPMVFPPDDHLPRVLMGEDGRRLNAAGDRILAEGLAGRSARLYYVVRPGPRLQAHETGERLGRSSLLLGRARVERPGNPALLVVEKAQQEIRPGDYLLPVLQGARNNAE
ncbi:MAG: hypothetical protein RI539_03515 [Spiribacter sp.]|jgi:hypothetical protein|nr:hypothetical protein [Spiribacter sp.]MDR9489396.1 hypothetical protein [Spiribacter sp.]